MTIQWRLCFYHCGQVYVGQSMRELQSQLDAIGYSGPAIEMFNRNGLRVGWVH